MFEFHKDKEGYFGKQAYTTQKYVIPFISEFITVNETLKVLEIGCAEGGNLKPFLDRGCKVTGVDIASHRIESAEKFFEKHPKREKLNLIVKDIYDAEGVLDNDFDLIMMRDVIEHIPNQEKFLKFIKRFLSPGGSVFFGFPPWQNPFGGHQQMCNNKILSRLPYFHLLPMPVYKFVLKMFGEKRKKIEGLANIKRTGITIERFHRIIKRENYTIQKRQFYFINPNYEIKFGLKPRNQLKIISSFPWIRNFFTTAVYYLIRK